MTHIVLTYAGEISSCSVVNQRVWGYLISHCASLIFWGYFDGDQQFMSWPKLCSVIGFWWGCRYRLQGKHLILSTCRTACHQWYPNDWICFQAIHWTPYRPWCIFCIWDQLSKQYLRGWWLFVQDYSWTRSRAMRSRIVVSRSRFCRFQDFRAFL